MHLDLTGALARMVVRLNDGVRITCALSLENPYKLAHQQCMQGSNAGKTTEQEMQNPM